MRIQHNIAAMSSYRNYNTNTSALNKNLEKLSSGYKINRAGDDAAGLAISEKMRAQITGLTAAQKNVKDGISLVKTAEGAMQEVQDMLNRMDYLATQSANGTYQDEVDRENLQAEVNELLAEIDRIADSANFNGIKLLDGSLSTGTSVVGSFDKASFSAGTAAVTSFVAASTASSPLSWPASAAATASATAGSVPSTSLMHLHSGVSTENTAGQFTIDLHNIAVGAASSSGAKSQIKVTLGSASATVTVGSSGTGGSTQDIVNALKDYVFAVNTDGTRELLTASATIDKGAVVYKATVGTGDKANQLTFTAQYVLKASVTASQVASSTALGASKAHNLAASSTAAKEAAFAAINSSQIGKDVALEVKISAVASKGALSGFTDVGVTENASLSKAGAGQFGQAVVQLATSKVTDGMVISVNGVEKTIKLSASGTGDIDLSAFASATASGTLQLKSSKAADIAQAIANAFQYDDEKLGGIEVAAQNGNLVIAEKVTAGGKSAATTEVQKAMSSYDSFKELVQFGTNQVITPEQKGSAKLNVDSGKLYNGTTLTITDPTGNKTSYTMTNDKTKTGTDPNGATYVYMGSDAAKALASAIGSKAAVGTDGRTVTVTYELAGGTAESAVQLKAERSGTKALTLQIGDTSDAFNQLGIEIKDMHADGLGVNGLSIATASDAAAAIQTIKDAINSVSSVRGTLGAKQNRLEHTANNLSVMAENIQDAESTIRDTDIAEEMMAYTKNNILVQSAQAMLAQANQIPQGVLQLLG